MEHKEDVQTSDDLSVHYEVIDLSANSPILHLGKHIESLTHFESMVHSDKVLRSNFYMDAGMPFNQPYTKPFEYEQVDVVSPVSRPMVEKVSLITLFNLLQREGASFLFQPYMYKDITGSQSFESFIPDSLSDIIVPFRNMIISNKKFNVVFATVISGRIQHDVTNGQVYRYYPFKMVKAGELVYDKIQVVFPNGCDNKFLKDTIMRNSVQDGIYYELDLTKFDLFENIPVPTATEFIYLRKELDALKIFTRALKYAIDELREYLQFKGEIGAETDWYRGDEVILDTLSDSGAPILEAWITGRKTSTSFKTIKNNLGEIGVQMFNIINNNLTEDVPLEVTQDTTKQLKTLLADLINKNWISNADGMQITSLLTYMEKEGTPKEKFIKLREELNIFNIVMNSVELKYINCRYVLLQQCPSKELMANDYLFSQFGEVTNSNTNNITYSSPVFQSKLTLKRTVVKDSEYSNTGVMQVEGFSNNDSVNSPLANNNLDINKPAISPNFRERD